MHQVKLAQLLSVVTSYIQHPLHTVDKYMNHKQLRPH